MRLLKALARFGYLEPDIHHDDPAPDECSQIPENWDETSRLPLDW